VTPRRYEFRVAGRLCAQAREGFGGMEVADAPTQTIIRGPVDESGLAQVLALLRDLGLPVVSLNRLPD
jgi:hypothetical protein